MRLAWCISVRTLYVNAALDAVYVEGCSRTDGGIARLASIFKTYGLGKPMSASCLLVVIIMTAHVLLYCRGSENAASWTRTRDSHGCTV